MPTPPMVQPAPTHPDRSRPGRPAFAPRRLVGAALTLAIALASVLVAGPASAQAEVRIEKATNGVDADAAPGPSVSAGTAVTWTWTISASGSTTLFDVVVTDTSGVRPSCDITGDGQPDGTNIHPGPIDPGQSFTCTASGAADHDPAAGAYAALGIVRATDFSAAASFEDQDPSHHSVAAPATTTTPPTTTAPPTTTIAPDPGISIRAAIEGAVATDVDGADGPLVGEGEAMAWTYVVTNTGNVPLVGVEVSDDRGNPVDCGSGTPVVAGTLSPGSSASCRVATVAGAQADGAQTATGSVVAAAVDPATGGAIGALQASDAVTFVPVQIPGQLAFTGPTDLVLPLGLALAVLGGALLLVTSGAARRPAMIAAGTGPADEGHPPTTD